MATKKQVDHQETDVIALVVDLVSKNIAVRLVVPGNIIVRQRGTKDFPWRKRWNGKRSFNFFLLLKVKLNIKRLNQTEHSFQ